MHLLYNSFQNTVGKGEIACTRLKTFVAIEGNGSYQHFLLFYSVTLRWRQSILPNTKWIPYCLLLTLDQPNLKAFADDISDEVQIMINVSDGEKQKMLVNF